VFDAIVAGDGPAGAAAVTQTGVFDVIVGGGGPAGAARSSSSAARRVRRR
jgi:alkyl hydroperoxide reductase subunit AhpF